MVYVVRNWAQVQFWAPDRSLGFSFYWVTELLSDSWQVIFMLLPHFLMGYVIVWRPSWMPSRDKTHRLERTNILHEFDM